MQFTYKGRTPSGQPQSGLMEAPSREEAINFLHQKGLVITYLSTEKSKPLISKDIHLFQHVKSDDLVAFSRQLASLFGAQVPLIEALRATREQTVNSYFKTIIFNVVSNVDGGMSLSEALSKHTNVFSEFYISMVRAGEFSGNLQESLEFMADYLQRSYEVASKVKSSMIYPAFVLGMFVIIGTVMMVFVVPKLTAIFKQFGGKLPLPTRILIAVSGFISHWYLELFLAIIVLVILAIYYASTERGKRFLDTMLLTLPVVKGISQKMYLSRFADNLSTLIKGGLPIVQALQVTSDVVGNRVYKSILAEAAEEVRKGNSISSVISKHAEFTPLIVQMVKTGEETGKLDSILLNISDFYKYEVNNSIDGLVALIEPALIVVLGLGVGVLVASILLPIYSLVSNIS